jgi:hypothetical protein
VRVSGSPRIRELEGRNDVLDSSSLGIATPDRGDKLIQSEQVGGRAHEPQCIRFVWCCGGPTYRDGGADGFSRDAFRRRCWQLEVLQQRWN